MYNTFLKSNVFIAAIICIFTLPNCSKSDSSPAPVDPINFFDNNFINKDLIIHLATDNGTTITSQYNGYILRFAKNAATSGSVSISNTLVSYPGTWTTTADHTTVTIVMPTPPNEFAFLNRQWKFTHYSIPIMELAPVASGDNKVLHFEVQ
jgi:hypothetical protein